ncbi:hypothetical protein HYR99_01355 [Candidatus Poribacteria bacterium]|nr:hypothetical protein [Candidatus Poribacteria bacterium]
MKYQLDITGKKFDCIDFSEARIFFSCPPKLGKTVTFEAWGVTLLTAPYWESMRCDLPHFDVPIKEGNIYISGISTVAIEEVIGGQIDIKVYQPHPPHDFLQLRDGEPLRLKRNWECEKLPYRDLYEMYCVIDWPLGYCYFAIAANGQATIEFRTEDCIPAREFVLNPERYDFSLTLLNLRH